MPGVGEGMWVRVKAKAGRGVGSAEAGSQAWGI